MLYRIYNLESKARGCFPDTTRTQIFSKVLMIRIDVNVSYSSKILAIGMILGEKIERKVYVNQQNFVSDIQLLIR